MNMPPNMVPPNPASMSKVDPGGMTDCRPSRFTSLRRWFAHRPRRNHLRGRKPTYAGIDIGENLIDVTTLSFDGWRNYRIPRDSNDRSNSDSLLIDLNHCLPPVRGGSIVHAAISMGGNGWDCQIGLDDEDETEFGDEEGQSDDSRDPATRADDDAARVWVTRGADGNALWTGRLRPAGYDIHAISQTIQSLGYRIRNIVPRSVALMAATEMMYGVAVSMLVHLRDDGVEIAVGRDGRTEMLRMLRCEVAAGDSVLDGATVCQVIDACQQCFQSIWRLGGSGKGPVAASPVLLSGDLHLIPGLDERLASILDRPIAIANPIPLDRLPTVRPECSVSSDPTDHEAVRSPAALVSPVAASLASLISPFHELRRTS